MESKISSLMSQNVLHSARAWSAAFGDHYQALRFSANSSGTLYYSVDRSYQIDVPFKFSINEDANLHLLFALPDDLNLSTDTSMYQSRFEIYEGAYSQTRGNEVVLFRYRLKLETHPMPDEIDGLHPFFEFFAPQLSGPKKA
jgi:hypothetical protein